jgi:NADP-reducing hydrogenase subunit HndB
MKRLASAEELAKLRDEIGERLSKRDKKTQVKVHLGTCGISSGAKKVLEAFQREVEARKLSDVTVLKAACIGLCDREPTVTVVHPTRGKTIYYDLSEDKVSRVVEQHLVNRKVVDEWKLNPNDPLLKLQEIRVMHNQDLDPMEIEEYIARDGAGQSLDQYETRGSHRRDRKGWLKRSRRGRLPHSHKVVICPQCSRRRKIRCLQR